jgi:hypothetical protein
MNRRTLPASSVTLVAVVALLGLNTHPAMAKPKKAAGCKTASPKRLGRFVPGSPAPSGTRLESDYKTGKFTIYGPNNKKVASFKGDAKGFTSTFTGVIYSDGYAVKMVRPDGTGDVVLACGDSPSLTPDSSTLFYNGTDRGYRLDADQNVATQVPSSPAVSPDGTHVAYSTVTGNNYNILVADLPVGEPKVLDTVDATGYQGTLAVQWTRDSTAVMYGLLEDVMKDNPNDPAFRMTLAGVRANIKPDDIFTLQYQQPMVVP